MFPLITICHGGLFTVDLRASTVLLARFLFFHVVFLPGCLPVATVACGNTRFRSQRSKRCRRPCLEQSSSPTIPQSPPPKSSPAELAVLLSLPGQQGASRGSRWGALRSLPRRRLSFSPSLTNKGRAQAAMGSPSLPLKAARGGGVRRSRLLPKAANGAEHDICTLLSLPRLSRKRGYGRSKRPR